MAAKPPANIFSRQTHPDPVTNQFIQDIYDKLASIQGGTTILQTETVAAQTTANTALSVAQAASGGGSGVSGLVPVVDPLPVTNGSPLDVDGQLVYLSPNDANLEGSLYRFSGKQVAWSQVLGPVIANTHANRGGYSPTDYPQCLYFETAGNVPDSDRTVLYAAVGANWQYVAGEMQDSSAAMGRLPGDLGASDAGFLYRNSFYFRVWEWNGSGWHYADGGVPAGGQIATSGPSPQGGLWQACDGSSVTCALDNATLGSLTASDTRAVAGNNPMIEGGAGGSPQAPSRFTWDPTAVTDNESTHTHPVTQTSIQQGTGASINVDTGNPTGAGSAHHHALSNANAVPNLFGETNGGLPQRVSLAWWMRR